MAAGARILVAGQAIFGTSDPERATRDLKARAMQALAVAPRPVSVSRAVSRVRVRYAETDQMGVVYYANYLVWFEVGRTDLLRLAGWSYREMEADGFALPVVEAHCDYRQSARYDDELEIVTTGAIVSPVRVRFDYQVVRAARRRNAGRRAHGARVARCDRQTAAAARPIRSSCLLA